jgi:LCP family protein required for cell wall assembly
MCSGAPAAHGSVTAMADGRDDRRGDDDGDGSSFDWLYSGNSGGSGSTGRPGPDDPDATQVISTGPRSGSGAGSGSNRPLRDDGPPTSIAPAPGAPPPSARRPVKEPREKRTRTRRRRPGRWLVLALVAWLVFLVAVPIFAWLSVEKVDAEPAGARPDDQPGTTYLVVGSDAREGLSGQRTDTILLLHTGSGPNLLMSLPRDSVVDIPDRGTNKLNAAFAFGGPKLLTRTIESETDIRIDHYVEIGFTGFVDLVDAVGGVEICPTKALDDPDAELTVEKGCQEADGETALGYARTRKTQTNGDIDRAKNQREVVAAIGSEVVSWKTIVNPIRYWRVMFGGAGAVKVSEGTGPFDAARFALAMTRVNGENGLTCGVPIADLVVNWDAERAPRMFEAIREDKTDEIGRDLCSPTGLPQ